ncbi:ParB/RepB/Spo0J family partition protein [Amaricoccus solimangrovi]|uniref:ParB/RepB/Spo0J family partition protein n=1 Tax=Amaricoccus solimangrovi TaxID=2589815 RepID=A0A501WFJ4_9RHOB|nr:ParB/RepB/Spo0J family partition protein [Amaricoccus solimangrovi]TPE46854.1 ParB/RepB/Spo0J family partition protein [Amaricoccus solimangrovi]
MSSKNKSFVDGLTASVEPAERAPRLGIGVLGGRHNRLAELASGAVVNSPQELVDPARCRIWERHNRDYAALSRDRCEDLIESILAQGRQEVPAIVRRVAGDPEHDFEVICGARRHWSVAWLRANNHPEIRYLVEIRDLTDEQAFRISDLENRAREDLSDIERARDYLRALGLYYGGRQKDMARRLNQSEAWLSRYLDLARLPEELVGAFADPFELRISHIGALKPLLKPEQSRSAVLAEALRLRRAREQGRGGVPLTPPDVIRALTAAARRPSGVTGAPKKTGTEGEVVRNAAGKPLYRLDRRDRKGVTVTLLPKEGGDRAEVEAALARLLDDHWPG